MRIELRDDQRRPVGSVAVDAAARPTRVQAEKPPSRLSRFGLKNPAAAGEPRSDSVAREVFLNWDTAMDDAGQLRRCVACGCADLFKEKAFPQVTAVIV